VVTRWGRRIRPVTASALSAEHSKIRTLLMETMSSLAPIAMNPTEARMSICSEPVSMEKMTARFPPTAYGIIFVLPAMSYTPMTASRKAAGCIILLLKKHPLTLVGGATATGHSCGSDGFSAIFGNVRQFAFFFLPFLPRKPSQPCRIVEFIPYNYVCFSIYVFPYFVNYRSPLLS
jgi:hypothetical protein